MANRCPDCNKFVSLETQEPEVESLELDVVRNADGPVGLLVTAEIKIIRACQECGTEIRTATLSFEQDLGPSIRAGLSKDCMVDHVADMQESSTDEERAAQAAKDKADNERGFGIHMHADGTETDEHTIEVEDDGNVEAVEVKEKGKQFFGATMMYSVQCTCGATLHEGSFSDKMLGSEMDEA